MAFESKPWVLLASGQVGWVRAQALGSRPRAPGDGWFLRPGVPGIFRPAPYCLPPGTHYARGVVGSARLHWFRFELGPDSAWVPRIGLAPSSLGSGGLLARQRWPLARFHQDPRLVFTCNGTFFDAGPRGHGALLGPVVQRGEFVRQDRPDAQARWNRSFLAVTTKGRVLFGESGESFREFFRGSKTRQGLGPHEDFEVLMGGLGRLVEDSDPRAWRRWLRRQFPPRFYSERVARPQILFGASDSGRVLHVLAQEGRPWSRYPLSLPQLAELATRLGMEEAAFGDGGGSVGIHFLGEALVRTEAQAAPRAVPCAFSIGEKPPSQEEMQSDPG